jgi:hypothetical protein
VAVPAFKAVRGAIALSLVGSIPTPSAMLGMEPVALMDRTLTFFTIHARETMMEDDNARFAVRKVRQWLIALLIFTVLNTFLILLLFAPRAGRGSDSDAVQSQSLSLPKGLAAAEQRETLFRSFMDVYNRRDYHGLWTMMSPAFRLKNPENTLQKSMERIYAIADKIDDGAYDHYEGSANTIGVRSYTLYYLLKVDGDKSATLTLNVYQQGSDPYLFNGFKVSID